MNTQTNPANEYVPEPTLPERWGLRVLRRHNDSSQGKVCHWPGEAVAAVSRVQTSAIRLAAVAGAVSGTVLALTEVGLPPLMSGDLEFENWRESLALWAVFLGIVLVVSALEIGYLYWLVLRSVGSMSRRVGLALTTDDRDRVMARGLCRAAMDYPAPRTSIYGIDPYASTTRLKLLCYAVLYRLKVGATSFVMRVVLRRVLARAAIRVFIPFLSVLVFAAWNAIIIRWAMQEARVRVAAPVAITDLDERLRERGDELKPAVRDALMAAVAESIRRSANAHPNFVLLLDALFRRFELSPGDASTDWQGARSKLGALDDDDRSLVLAVATTTVLLGGRPRKPQRELLREIHEACGVGFDADALPGLYRAYLDGKGISDQSLQALRGGA